MFNDTNIIYKYLLKSILYKGAPVDTRNHSVISAYNLDTFIFKSFPLVTTRKTAWNKAIREMEWFLSGDIECPEELRDWWKGQLDKDNNYIFGYGEQLRYYSYFDNLHTKYKNYDQVKFILDALKSNPNSRRLILTTWNPGEMACITQANLNDKTPTTCFPKWVLVLTKEGLKQIGDISIGEMIWNGKKFIKVTAKFSKGKQEVYEFTTRKGKLYCTKEHKVYDGKKVIPINQAKRIAISEGPDSTTSLFNKQAVMDGLIIADGVSTKGGNRRKQMSLHIGEKDFDYFTSEISELIVKQNAPTHNPTQYSVQSDLKELPPVWEREVPSKYFLGDAETKCAFLRGYFSGNGFHSSTLGIISTSEKLVTQLQLMLHSIGILTSVSERGEQTTTWENGTYTSKKAYVLIVLAQHKSKFLQKIGFIQKYKQNKPLKDFSKVTSTAKINATNHYSTEEVFDITVDSEDHLFWCNGFIVSNCHSSFVQFFVRDDTLHMKSYNRSADILLGTPHNWVQSWALLLYFAYHSDLNVGDLIWVFGDAHIYQEDSHMKAVLEILNSPEVYHKVNLIYDPEEITYDNNDVPKFNTYDFYLDGEIPSPLVLTRPKLL